MEGANAIRRQEKATDDEVLKYPAFIMVSTKKKCPVITESSKL